ncbi:MAG: Type secretion system protein [Deltaproteobacteria bacterium]|nr:Type secretion system protein [Deltaproteobacteria bacterium]MBS1245041.1 Type secretion system protein [Deltaproteobacteria bacterium]
MRKPVYLGVLGISIVVAAVSLGVTLTRYLGLRAYSPKGTAQATATPAGPAVPAAPPEEWKNLFAPVDGMNLASRLPAANASSASQAQRSNFVLVGTIVSSRPSARRAVLWANGMKEPKAFREKEEVEPGAILASVERDKVWILRGKEREKLEILPVGSRARPTATAASTVPPPGSSAARPSPDKAQAMGTPDTSSEDDEEERHTSRARRRRAQGLPR